MTFTKTPAMKAIDELFNLTEKALFGSRRSEVR